MNNKQIAQTILEQMKALDSNLMICMGVHKLQVIENGLQFKVNGLSFKGVVQITLNGSDLYDVKFLKPTRKQNPVAKELGVKSFDTIFDVYNAFEDVFVEDLMVVLENFVENKTEKRTYKEIVKDINAGIEACDPIKDKDLLLHCSNKMENIIKLVDNSSKSDRINKLGLKLIQGGKS